MNGKKDFHEYILKSKIAEIVDIKVNIPRIAHRLNDKNGKKKGVNISTRSHWKKVKIIRNKSKDAQSFTNDEWTTLLLLAMAISLLIFNGCLLEISLIFNSLLLFIW